MKVAIVHDWLVTYAGAERVLEQMLKIWPHADLFSIVDFLKPDERGFISDRKVTTSFIQKMPGARRWYRNWLPLMPLAVEQFDLTGYELVISSSHAVAKGVLVGPDQVHICLCHSPIRYAWDLQAQYLKESNLDTGVKSYLVRWLLHRIRIWDFRSASGVDFFVAVSEFISRRIKKAYRRESHVIYPPVDVEEFQLKMDKEDFYLASSRLVPYKKLPLIIESFSSMPDKKLIVIGDGPDAERCKSLAGNNVIFMGYQSTAVLKDHMQRAKAFVFAAEEDFGIIPVEAQACGTPVIAFGKGGALETIRGQSDQAPTGVFFYEQTVESIVAAVSLFENEYFAKIKPQDCRDNANKFSQSRFRAEFQDYVERKWREFKKGESND
jgi:glycosyltransferase involved in cell wall biosynthesis